MGDKISVSVHDFDVDCTIQFLREKAPARAGAFFFNKQLQNRGTFDTIPFDSQGIWAISSAG